MNAQRPQIELEHDWVQPNPPLIVPVPWYKSYRLKVFSISLLMSVFISLTYVFTQPTIYQSYATLLTVAKTAIDQRSSAVDIEHVVIQKRILLGHELFIEVAKRLQFSKGLHELVTLANLHQMLSVEPVENTNLVKMIAEGSDPIVLPIVINIWIEVYLDSRKKDVLHSTGSITETLENELNNLTQKIESKRNQLDVYRKKNNISSNQRDENGALIRLKGLNDALNVASQEVVNAKAKLQAVSDAIKNGQDVVSSADTRTLSLLESQAQILREQLADLDQRFTREYIALNPSLKVIPKNLENLEAKIFTMRNKGKEIVLADAKQQYAAALQAVESIKNQLSTHNKLAADFTSRFTEHEGLQNDLTSLEHLFSETQDRLLKIDTKQVEKHSQVSIVEGAFLPQLPVSPDYKEDALIAIVGSFIFSLSAVWIVGFLVKKEEPNSSFNLSGIHLHNNNLTQQQMLKSSAFQSLPLHQGGVPDSSLAQEISNQELETLMDAANLKSKQLIALLLSGLSLEEIVSLPENGVDITNSKITVLGDSVREIALHPVLKTLFSENKLFLKAGERVSLSYQDLTALMHCAIVDAGLSELSGVDASVISRNYIIYLVGQGMRLSDLELIFGAMSPTELSSFSVYSPPVAGRPFVEIDLLHPALLSI